MSPVVSPIAKSSPYCSICLHRFASGEICISALHPQDENWTNLSRKDYCDKCYQEQKVPPLASWNFLVKSRNNKSLMLSQEAIWQVLEKACTEKDLREKPLTFILCLMMERKRKLRTLSTRKHLGEDYQTFSNKSRKLELEVKIPMLGPVAFSRLQAEISNFFAEGGV